MIATEPVWIERLAEPAETSFWTTIVGIAGALGLGGLVVWFVQGTLNPRRIARWWRSRDTVPGAGTHFTVLIADLDDDQDGKQTRHVRAALLRSPGLEVELTGRVLRLADLGSQTEAQLAVERQGRELLKERNGDLLIWGEVRAADKELCLWFLSGEGISTLGTPSYSLTEKLSLPENFNRDLGVQIEALALASLAPATEQQVRYLVDLLKQPAEKLERLLAKGAPGLDPEQVAGLRFAYGNAASALGEQSAESDWLEKAVAAYEAALDETTRERAPGYWAMIKNNLGLALTKIGQMEGDTARLERAVATFEEAAAEWTRDLAPLQWAGLQNNRGLALTMIGQRERGTQSLEKAIAAYRLALEEWTECLPLDRAIAQNNLGYALTTLGERQGDASLEGAIDAYREALDLGSRESAPLVWAMSQNGLASALAHLGRRNRDLEMLNQATRACHEALAVLGRDRMPLQWAHTQDTLGFALVALGECGSDVRSLEEGVEAYRAALATYRKVAAEFDIEDTKASLARAESLLAERRRSTTTH